MPFARRRAPQPRPAAANRDPARLVAGSEAWKTYVADAMAVAPGRRSPAQKREILRAMRGEDDWPEPLRNDFAARLDDIATRVSHETGAPRSLLGPRDWHLTVVSHPSRSVEAAHAFNRAVADAVADGADAAERLAPLLKRYAELGAGEPEVLAVGRRVAEALVALRPSTGPGMR